MANVVLVIDMLRGFLEPGHTLYCGDHAREIIPPVRNLVERERAAGSTILFLADNHDPDDLEFQVFPPHCVKGTAEREVIPELADLATEVLPKNRYSSFWGGPLADRLRDLKPDRLILAGVCTDICVLHTAADARNRDYAVEIPADCVATFDPDAHEWALKHAATILGVRVTGAVPPARA